MNILELLPTRKRQPAFMGVPSRFALPSATVRPRSESPLPWSRITANAPGAPASTTRCSAARTPDTSGSAWSCAADAPTALPASSAAVAASVVTERAIVIPAI